MSKGDAQANELASMNADLKNGGAQGEKQLQAKTYDEKKVGGTMAKLNEELILKKEVEASKEKELAAIQVKAEDIEAVSTHCDLTKAVAKRKLQQKNGDIAAVLKDYIHGR
jgi:NACalpha-BTF3-like transcription factor